MKLATLNDGTRDGQLAVLARDHKTVHVADDTLSRRNRPLCTRTWTPAARVVVRSTSIPAAAWRRCHVRTSSSLPRPMMVTPKTGRE
jgi:hypothetical protein